MTARARCALIAALAVVPGIARADRVAVTEDRLPNGLALILAPDPSASSVAVHVRYAFGAADETTAEAGFAHLVERLLGAGSVHVADPDAMLDGVGGWTTSATTADHVSITDVVPAGALELALWLEADRMAGVAETIDARRVSRALAGIAAERRSAYEDHPYALVARALEDELWDGRHVLGDPSPTRVALAAFARAHVAPATATLVIAGGFDPEQARALVERYFGWIPAGSRPLREVPEPVPRTAPARREVADPIAKVVVAARSDLPYRNDDVALELAAQIIAGGRTSRLGKQLGASEVHGEVIRDARGGELEITVTLARADDRTRVSEVIEAELGRLRDAPVEADELARARAALDMRLVAGLESLAFRADALASWASYTGHADALQALRDQRAAITPAAVQRAARRWLMTTELVTIIGRGAP